MKKINNNKMELLKITIYSIILSIFLFSLTIFIQEIISSRGTTSGPATAGVGGLIIVILMAVIVVSGIISLIIFIKAPTLYKYITYGIVIFYFSYLSLHILKFL